MDTQLMIRKEAEALPNSDPRVRLQAIRNLSQIALELPVKERGEIVEYLGQLVNDPEAFIRWNVAISL